MPDSINPRHPKECRCTDCSYNYPPKLPTPPSVPPTVSAVLEKLAKVANREWLDKEVMPIFAAELEAAHKAGLEAGQRMAYSDSAYEVSVAFGMNGQLFKKLCGKADELALRATPAAPEGGK